MDEAGENISILCECKIGSVVFFTASIDGGEKRRLKAKASLIKDCFQVALVKKFQVARASSRKSA